MLKIKGWRSVLLTVLLIISVFLIFIAFVFPLNLYPFHDFSRNFLAVFGSLFLGLAAFIFKIDNFSVSRITFFIIPFLLILILSIFKLQPEILISYNKYIIAFFAITMTSVSITTLSNRFSREKVLDLLLKFILVISIVSSLFALIRFYGALGYIVSIVQIDGDRLIGPIGQPNLTAIVLSLGVMSLCYLRFHKKCIGPFKFFLLLTIFFYSGSLTASRSWWLAVIICCIVIFLYLVQSKDSEGRGVSVKDLSPSLMILVFLIVFHWVAPKVDSILAGPLIDSGFIERAPAEQVSERRAQAGGSGRISEWIKTLNGYESVESVWFGHGPGRYGVFSNVKELESEAPGNGRLWNHAHNIFLMFFIEWGLIGLIFILVLFIYCAWQCVKTLMFSKEQTVLIFPAGLVLIILAHSLVGFSLWYLPFLCLFISAFSLFDRSYNFGVSSKNFPKFLVIIISFTFFPIGYYLAKDIYDVTKIMYSGENEFSDMWVVGDISKNSLIGDKALIVYIHRFPLMTSGVERSLDQLDDYINWRPLPLYLMRKSALMSRFRSVDVACPFIEKSVRLYPEIVGQLLKEMESLNSQLDHGRERIGKLRKCIEKGLNPWTQAQRDDFFIREAVKILKN